MLLTESASSDVRQRAFSTLSTLSTYATQNALVMTQIQQALKLPEGVSGKQYVGFVKDRLKK
jgi:hypothetical protein